MEPIINIEHLYREFKVLNRRPGLKGSFLDLFSRDYKIIKAVDNLSLKIHKGEMVGFLGTNGAGKSTTIKMMIGVLQQTGGKIEVNGLNPYVDRSRYLKDIGVVFGQRTQLWWALPVRESFYILKNIYEVNDKEYEENIQLFHDIVGLDDIINKPARQLSLGQRTLCDILIAFLHNPCIVFLDEPTIGLDVSMKYKIHDLIRQLNKRKKTTVVLTTHDMGDVDALCSRVIIINKGKSIYDNSMTSLVKYFGDYKTLHLRYSEEKREHMLDLCKLVKNKYENFKSFNLKLNEHDLEITVDEKDVAILGIVNFIQKHMNMHDISISELSTEEIVRKMYEEGAEYA